MTTDPQSGETKPRRPKPRVYQEDAKTRQTSHWDWDYLPLKTLERLARERPTVSPDAETRQDPLNQRRIALICIAVGTLLLTGLLVVLAFVGPKTI